MIVGLTGGIGSGKSTVAALFELMGAAVFNSDEVAKQCYFLPEVKSKVIDLLGAEAYTALGAVNRVYIAEKVFSNTDLLQQLNAIIHPAVKLEMQQFENKNKNALLVKESALLFEANLQNQVDKIIVVAAPDDLRIQRSMARDRVSREQVLARIKAQMPQEQKIAAADFVVYNNEQQSLIQQVTAIIQQLN